MKIIIHCKNEGLYFENKNIEKNTSRTSRNVVKKNFFLLNNEIRISKIIKQIPYFFVYFDPILNHREFKIAEIDDDRFEKCTILNNSGEYFLLNYINREKIVSFASFLKESRQENRQEFNKLILKKKFIIKIINSFKNLLKMVNLLNAKNIVHMILTPKYIFFNEYELPILTNFEKSFILEDNNIEIKNKEDIYKINFSYYDPQKIYFPIEIHLLCYMNEHNYMSLSASNIENVVDQWIACLSITSIKKYIYGDLKNNTLACLRCFINKPKCEIHKMIFSFAHTWNNYSLSIIYLQILSSLDDKVYPHRFTKEYVSLLLNNVSGNYSKRETPDSTLALFDEIVSSISQHEWNNLFSQI
jgi:hypothetical protein